MTYTTLPSRRLAVIFAALFVALLWQNAALAQGELAATVSFVSGDGVVAPPQGEQRSAKKGMQVFSGDTVHTRTGSMQLRMVDGGMMSLQPDTTLRLDEYHLAGASSSGEKAHMSLLNGKLRTISGFIGKALPDNYRLKTQVAIVGIRGTEYTAAMRDGLTVGVIGGKVAVCNDTGCVDVAKGQSAFVASIASPPNISRLVTMVVPATGLANDVQLAGAPLDTILASASSVQTAQSPRTGGEQVRGYLQRVLQPAVPTPGATAVVPAAPTNSEVAGSFSLPPATALPLPGSSGNATLPIGLIVAPVAPTTIVLAPSVPVPSVTDLPVVVAVPLVPVVPAVPGAPVVAAPVVVAPVVVAPVVVAPVVVAPVVAVAPAPTAPSIPAPTSPLPVLPVLSALLSGSIATAPVAPLSGEVVLASSTGTVVVVSQERNGVLGASALNGYRQFNGAALVGLQEAQGSGVQLLANGVPADARADGVVAWGRWTGGISNFKGSPQNGTGEVASLHYFSFAGLPSLPVLTNFNSFGSTAPTITSATGVLMGTGAENTASGSLQVNFASAIGGSASYQLTVPAGGQTFSMAGRAAQTGIYGFAGTGTISSSGAGCNIGCAGALSGGNTVQGMVGGTGSSRAGLVYGFTSGMGNVSGAMVFKP